MIHRISINGVFSTVDHYNDELYNYFAYEIPVINNGIVVEIQSTRCNGIKECWDNVDELECGFSTSFTIFVGMYLVSL